MRSYQFLKKDSSGRLSRNEEAIFNAEFRISILPESYALVLKERLENELEDLLWNGRFFLLQSTQNKLYEQYPLIFTEEKKQYYSNLFNTHYEQLKEGGSFCSHEWCQYHSIQLVVMLMINDILRVRTLPTMEYLQKIGIDDFCISKYNEFTTKYGHNFGIDWFGENDSYKAYSPVPIRSGNEKLDEAIESFIDILRASGLIPDMHI
jgi:hypothetical protein